LFEHVHFLSIVGLAFELFTYALDHCYVAFDLEEMLGLGVDAVV
jgi:hypothetical protein